jgi:hypothetical protein
MAQKQYVLGRGKVYLALFKTGTQVPDGYRYIGNTPEFSLTIESEELDHYSSDEGIREKDDSVPLEVNRTGTLVTDNINPENVALFFFGQTLTITQTAVASSTEVFTGAKAGMAYKLGQSPANPTGYFGIDTAGFAVTLGAVALTSGVDYTMDYLNGLVVLSETSAKVLAGGSLNVTYAVKASTRSRVISGSAPIEGALMYVTKNPKGKDATFIMPYIKITPNGDYALKGDDWQQIPMSLEVLKPDGAEAIYRDGNPVY